MSDFFRFPHTPHRAWLGKDQPRDDKVLAADEAGTILAHEVIVEEKVDGANVGFSTDEQGSLRVQNRGTYLSQEACRPQFTPLFRWIELRHDGLVDALFPDLMLFGEWCYAIHSIRYTKLPDWFLAFDVYYRRRREFWSVARRDELVQRLGLAEIPCLAKGRFDLSSLEKLFDLSRISDGPAEGIYVRQEEGDRLVARAKLVRPEFTQAIGEHWSRRAIQPNKLVGDAAWH